MYLSLYIFAVRISSISTNADTDTNTNTHTNTKTKTKTNTNTRARRSYVAQRHQNLSGENRHERTYLVRIQKQVRKKYR